MKNLKYNLKIILMTLGFACLFLIDLAFRTYAQANSETLYFNGLHIDIDVLYHIGFFLLWIIIPLFLIKFGDEK